MNSFLYLSLLVATANCFYINDGTTEKNKIVGGDYDIINHVPYQIQLIENGSQVCGGSIISKQWILTASHCVDGSVKKSLEIITGSTYRGKGGEKHKVEEVIMHEYYDSSDFYNDIALIKVTKPIQFNPKQKPIRIATEVPKIGAELFISGFGKEADHLPGSRRLKSAAIPVVDHTKCYESYIGANDITDDMFCAGVGGTDTCQGDSGGPAVFNKKLVGVTSFGIDCASDDYPGVYTLLPNYREWIAEHTGLKL